MLPPLQLATSCLPWILLLLLPFFVCRYFLASSARETLASLLGVASPTFDPQSKPQHATAMTFGTGALLLFLATGRFWLLASGSVLFSLFLGLVAFRHRLVERLQGQHVTQPASSQHAVVPVSLWQLLFLFPDRRLQIRLQDADLGRITVRPDALWRLLTARSTLTFHPTATDEDQKAAAVQLKQISLTRYACVVTLPASCDLQRELSLSADGIVRLVVRAPASASPADESAEKEDVVTPIVATTPHPSKKGEAEEVPAQIAAPGKTAYQIPARRVGSMSSMSALSIANSAPSTDEETAGDMVHQNAARSLSASSSSTSSSSSSAAACAASSSSSTTPAVPTIVTAPPAFSSPNASAPAPPSVTPPATVAAGHRASNGRPNLQVPRAKLEESQMRIKEAIFASTRKQQELFEQRQQQQQQQQQQPPPSTTQQQQQQQQPTTQSGGRLATSRRMMSLPRINTQCAPPSRGSLSHTHQHLPSSSSSMSAHYQSSPPHLAPQHLQAPKSAHHRRVSSPLFAEGHVLPPSPVSPGGGGGKDASMQQPMPSRPARPHSASFAFIAATSPPSSTSSASSSPTALSEHVAPSQGPHVRVPPGLTGRPHAGAGAAAAAGGGLPRAASMGAVTKTEGAASVVGSYRAALLNEDAPASATIFEESHDGGGGDAFDTIGAAPASAGYLWTPMSSPSALGRRQQSSPTFDAELYGHHAQASFTPPVHGGGRGLAPSASSAQASSATWRHKAEEVPNLPPALTLHPDEPALAAAAAAGGSVFARTSLDKDFALPSARSHGIVPRSTSSLSNASSTTTNNGGGTTMHAADPWASTLFPSREHQQRQHQQQQQQQQQQHQQRVLAMDDVMVPPTMPSAPRSGEARHEGHARDAKQQAHVVAALWDMPNEVFEQRRRPTSFHATTDVSWQDLQAAFS